MATYVVLANWTQQGIEHVRESPERTARGKAFAKSLGAEIKAFYLLMGQYDTMWIVEAPDDETMAKVCLAIGSQGSVSTVTLRAWNEAEYKKICKAIPEKTSTAS